MAEGVGRGRRGGGGGGGLFGDGFSGWAVRWLVELFLDLGVRRGVELGSWGYGSEESWSGELMEGIGGGN